MNMKFDVRVLKEGNQFIAHAIHLDVSSAGDTPQAALEAVREAIKLFIATAQDHGTLSQVFKDCGYVLENGKWVFRGEEPPPLSSP
jgi:predicted RNase H-like HicB family nuclease